MFGIGLPELIVILVLALIVLGPEKLPVVAKQVARFMNDLKKATEEFKQELELDKLDDIKNPVKLENLLGEDISGLKKDLSPPDFLSSDQQEGQNPKDKTLGGLGPEWKQARGRGKNLVKESAAAAEEEKASGKPLIRDTDSE